MQSAVITQIGTRGSMDPKIMHIIIEATPIRIKVCYGGSPMGVKYLSGFRFPNKNKREFAGIICG
ncbi:MAG: hypothetical protein ACTSUS_01785 [Candidatus Freyarchaeota archaeon]